MAVNEPRQLRAGPEREQRTSRATILDAIRTAGVISRVELTGRSGLTAPSVTKIVQRLLDEGLVEEIGRGASTGGKPRTLIRLRADARYVLGAHLTVDDLTFVLVDFAGGVVSRWRQQTSPEAADGARDPGRAVEAIRARSEYVLAASGVDRDQVIGLGFVCPGPLRRDVGITSASPSWSGWVGYPIRARLEETLGWPVLLDNDATAAAAGTRLSTTHEESVLAVLFLSQGIGAGLRIESDVYAGAHGNAGEVGHICVDPQGPRCWCGAVGCLEAVSGPAAVVAKAHAAGIDTGAADRSVTAAFVAVCQRARGGDPRAAEVVREAAEWLAIGAQAVTTMYDSRILVLTGPAFAAAGALFLPAAKDRILSSSFGRAADIEVVIDERGHDAAAIGAAVMMLQTADAAAAPSATRPALVAAGR